jgi:hypothetical protein
MDKPNTDTDPQTSSLLTEIGNIGPFSVLMQIRPKDLEKVQILIVGFWFG